MKLIRFMGRVLWAPSEGETIGDLVALNFMLSMGLLPLSVKICKNAGAAGNRSDPAPRGGTRYARQPRRG